MQEVRLDFTKSTLPGQAQPFIWDLKVNTITDKKSQNVSPRSLETLSPLQKVCLQSNVADFKRDITWTYNYVSSGLPKPSFWKLHICVILASGTQILNHVDLLSELQNGLTSPCIV